MRKNVLLSALSLGILCLTANVSAVPVTFTYTADNVVNAWFQNGSAPPSLSLGPNNSNWQMADTGVVDLNYGHVYQIIFQLENSDLNESRPPSNQNPGGFLGQITAPVGLEFTPGSLLSSDLWEVAYAPSDDFNFDTLEWQFATEYGANNSSTLWHQVNGGPVAGISEDAQWIWWEDNFADEDSPGRGESVFVRVTVEPVPEPATLLLVGAGLAGLAGVRRKKSKKNS